MLPISSYEIFTDGGSRGNPGPGASAFIIYKNKKIIYKQSYYFNNTTNNVAEYFAVLMAVTWISKNMNISEREKLSFYLDSELVARQLTGKYKIKNAKLKSIYLKILEVIDGGSIKPIFNHIPREKNTAADFLVNEKIDENTP